MSKKKKNTTVTQVYTTNPIILFLTLFLCAVVLFVVLKLYKDNKYDAIVENAYLTQIAHQQLICPSISKN
jgi:hypothetical protein